MLRKAITYILFFLWLLLLFIEAWVWGNVQDLFLPDHPVMQIVASLLQDTMWIPLALALPAYAFYLYRRVEGRPVYRWAAGLTGLIPLIWTLISPTGFFRWLIFFIALYFIVFSCSFKKHLSVRANVMVFSLALLGVVLHYRQQLLPRLLMQPHATLTVLDYNIRVNQNKKEREQVLSLIEQLKPDLVFIQEIASQDRNLFSQRFKQAYPYQLWADRRENYNGGAILSQFPFLSSQNIDIRTEYSSSHFNLNQAIIEVAGKPIHLLNGHLFPSGHAFIELLAGQRTLAGFIHDTRSTYLRRMSEADRLAERVQKIKGRVILAGDFNDTPHSYTYELFDRSLQNAFREAGWGLGTTFGHFSLKKSLSPFWAQFAFDFLRIDHVFVSSGLRVVSAQILPLAISDHRAQLIGLRLE